ncbi:hypothetical protein A249_06917 [Pseudomonas syringae pv. actinidiae ICMP 18804]|uniref:Uncharacterized protein n=4 Tax=Pseudomonas syringae TaxID=317 RepID=A0A656JN66_PSESF|nr:hypothetical protein A246_04425 [Pseudomonas syringae pv. actinidiae ICMP 19098]EPN16346.1 hypothetical protein A249_06917 [Pseudomonas syringae pv. actinidiae ICMP 18804]EPN20989.1 hypothetical protein A248_04763 [Pseudomonas syringae pv. actinidiae ICMP 19100]EPN28580.1 hypothetical protein A247_04612 [Pseudomonas syringae pv. actinidiae ICMP 19099]EPN36787.1 hypothetical protein A243_04877 [Pseudomonas syringae pv. actinidiae ICMP 18883]EPN39772.1 hypothetical protein A245_36954 [Pseudom
MPHGRDKLKFSHQLPLFGEDGLIDRVEGVFAWLPKLRVAKMTKAFINVDPFYCLLSGAPMMYTGGEPRDDSAGIGSQRSGDRADEVRES